MNPKPIADTWLFVLFVVAIVIVAYLLGFADGKAHGSESPVWQVVAEKALAGDFGDLADWQEKGYKHIAERGATRKLAWITAYWEGEPGVGSRTASGRRVSSQVCAMLDVKFGTYVLISLPRGYELRQVFDRGSRRNAARAHSRGASVWIDRWIPRSAPYHEKNATYVRAIYVAQ